VAPGQVYVLVIPHILDPARYLMPGELEPSPAAIRVIRRELDQKRLLTTRLDIRPPDYHWVAVRVQCRPNLDTDENRLRGAIEARLYRFLNPLTGGPEGKGWPFGRELFESDVYQSLQAMPGVQFIRKVSVFVTTAGAGIKGNAVETVEIVEHGTIASGVHEIVFV
jgi:predicted phage baseplate assembly protein